MLDPYAEGFDWSSPTNNVLVARWPELCDMVAHAIIPALDRLIADPAGYPVDFTGMPTSGLPAYMVEESSQRWSDILITIRRGFEAHLELDQLVGARRDQATEDRKEGLALFAQYFPHLWS